MLALMPRCTECVRCGDPIQGKGRIDRIYCSASCRTLAWRARSGKGWAGRRKSLPPQPGSYVARRALPLLFGRMKAALEAKKRRVAELEDQLYVADSSTPLAAGTGVATVGAIGLLVALQKRLGRKHRAELAQIRALLEAEENHRRTEMTAMQAQAAQRQAELERELAASQRQVEQATRDRQAAASTISDLERAIEALRQQHEKDDKQLWANEFAMARLRKQEADARAAIQTSQTTLLGESRRREDMQVQLAATQKQLIEERASWQTAYGEREEDIRQLELQLNEERSSWQTAYRQLDAQAQTQIQQLSDNCSNWQTAYWKLEAEAEKRARQSNTNARLHHEQLAALNSRAETAEAAVTKLRLKARRQNRAQLEQIQIAAARPELPSSRQRRKKSASLSAAKKPKALPKKKKKAQKKLPPKQGFVERLLTGAAKTTTVVVAAIVGGKVLRKERGKKIPPKGEVPYFEVTPVSERKRLPPKRD